MNARTCLRLILAASLGLLAIPAPASIAQTSGCPERDAALPPIQEAQPLFPTGPLSSIALPEAISRPYSVEPNYSGCGGLVPPVVNAIYEQEVVDLVNAARAANGLPPLQRITLLDNAARYHAVDLGQDDYFQHDSYDRVGGQLVQVCAWTTRLDGYYSNWQTLAENIVAGYGTPQAVMEGWMASAGHRDNILRATVWEIGVGYYQGSGTYHRYWVQDFGRRFGVYPLIIEQDAEAVSLPNVTLYIYGDWSEVRLRNDDGPWTSWLPFQNNLNWTLDSRLGEQMVWAELRNGAQTATSSDAIRVDGVDLEDIVAAASGWPCQAGQPCFDPTYDIDWDGDLDVADVMRVAALWMTAQ